jgi:hypothetical protein
MLRFTIQTENIQWGRYKNQITLTTDAEKFDDMLRIICSVNKEERVALQEYLEQAYQQKRLCHGIHISNRALMTCLIFERMGSQVQTMVVTRWLQ